jgi:hypothetical protein
MVQWRRASLLNSLAELKHINPRGDYAAYIWRLSFRYLGGGIVLSSELSKRKANYFQNIKVHHLGAALAHNLIDEQGVLLKWGLLIGELLEKSTDVNAIVLVFGEIDIRAHIIKRAITLNVHPFLLNEQISNRLHKYAIYLKNKYRIPIFIQCPVPSAMDFDGDNHNLPHSGSQRERNYLTYLFGKNIESQNKDISDIYIINLFNQLTDKILNTDKYYYADHCHLNLNGLNLLVDKFNEIIQTNKLTLKEYYQPEQLKFTNEITNNDITHKCRIRKLSSSYDGDDYLIKKNTGRDYLFHTKLEKNPYIVIDIGYISMIDKIVLGNRKGHEQRCQNLTISISKDDREYSVIKECEEIFGLDGNYLEVPLISYIGEIRFIKIELKSENFLHLNHLEIFEKSFLAN